MQKNIVKQRRFHFGETDKDIFTFKELENLFNLRPFVNTERFIITEKNSYSFQSYSWGTDKNSIPISIIKKIIKKDVAYLRDCGRVNKKINNICKELETIFKQPADCHIYFSFKKNVKGFSKHRDNADNFIVLCEGSLKVEVWNKEKTTKIMQPGEYVFIPKQIDHRITPLTDKRLSCSFPVEQCKKEKFFDEREWLTLS